MDGVGLGRHLHGFFGDYLVRKGVSKNTLRSYGCAMAQYLEFAASECGGQVDGLAFGNLGGTVLEAFLSHLADKGLAASTRNNRLAAIHAFFRYVQRRDPSCFEVCHEVIAVEKTKAPQPTIGYLSIKETTMLLSLPDAASAKGLRHLATLALLYESAARVQEVIDARRGDVNLGQSVITLHGKGQKTRVAPIGKQVTAILKRYMASSPGEAGDLLFPGRYGNASSHSGIQYVIDRYVGQAKEAEPHMFTIRVTAHTFRHSRSMHLLEAGVNLIYISDLLGHKSISTSQIYAKANPETKRKEIEAHSDSLMIKTRYSKKEQADLLAWLKSIQ